MKHDLKYRRALLALGQRAVDYYNDTGECVFCEVDDCEGVPHDEECSVGEVLGVTVDAERVAKKLEQRRAVFKFLHDKALAASRGK